jgi:N-acetylneuraminate synthase/sialic acid synthase
MRELTIAGTRISDDSPCFVVAEIGHNHQGSLVKARDLVRASKECSADAVKFQKRDNSTLFTRAFYDSPYDNENSFGPTYGAHREALELSPDDWLDLKRYAHELGLAFVAAAFDLPSADFLGELGVDAFKFASGDLLNLPLQRHIAAFGKPLLLSTGGGTLEDIERAVDAILPLNPQLAVLHCTASYPAEVEDLNLRVITTLRERYPELVIGYSDHHNGIAMSLVAYLLGARVIEKHFTLNHAWKGTDHPLSLMPEGMRKLVRDLRRAPVALGDGVKRPLPSEESALRKMGKQLVAARDLEVGHVLGASDLAIKSPAEGGLPPFELDRLIGRALARPLRLEQPVMAEDLEPAEAPAPALRG